jgi:hypothetical protein
LLMLKMILRLLIFHPTLWQFLNLKFHRCFCDFISADKMTFFNILTVFKLSLHRKNLSVDLYCNNTFACLNHTRARLGHTCEFGNDTRACRSHTLREKIAVCV